MSTPRKNPPRSEWPNNREHISGAAASRPFSSLGMEQHKIPHYVLVSSSSRAQPSTATGSVTPVLSHPVLQYHYANDSPLSLLPRFPDEQVLVLDYDPLNPSYTRAQSISGSSAVTGIKVTDAPGAGSAEGDVGWSKSMFVLETTTFESRFAHLPGARHLV
jgi:hypothetical protein